MVSAVRQGTSFRTVARHFGVTLRTVEVWVARVRGQRLDRVDHASIVDGGCLSFGKVTKFEHNDVADLESLLKSNNGNAGGKLIIVDGVFSMQGDLMDIPGVVRLARQYGARLTVDEAHAVGVLGKNGRGTAEHFGLDHDVDITMGTFSKSFAALGRFVASIRETVDYLKHFGRAMIFSASLPPGVVASVLAALDIIEKEPERRERLLAISQKMRAEFRSLGFDTGASQSPVIPIFVGEHLKTFRFAKALFDEGIYVNAAVSPAVPVGMSLLRTSYMATHTDAQLDRILETVGRVGRKLSLV